MPTPATPFLSPLYQEQYRGSSVTTVTPSQNNVSSSTFLYPQNRHDNLHPLPCPKRTNTSSNYFYYMLYGRPPSDQHILKLVFPFFSFEVSVSLGIRPGLKRFVEDKTNNQPNKKRKTFCFCYCFSDLLSLKLRQIIETGTRMVEGRGDTDSLLFYVYTIDPIPLCVCKGNSVIV